MLQPGPTAWQHTKESGVLNERSRRCCWISCFLPSFNELEQLHIQHADFCGASLGSTNLFIGPVLRVQAWLEKAAKDDTAAFREQLLRTAHSTAQVLAHQLPQDVPEMPLVLVINEAVMEDTHALMQPQAHQRLLAVALLLAHHQHALHPWL